MSHSTTQTFTTITQQCPKCDGHGVIGRYAHRDAGQCYRCRGLGFTKYNKRLTWRSFWDMLANHDWYYSFSDDHSVYKAGTKSEARIKKLAEQHPVMQNMYKAWEDYIHARITGEDNAGLLGKPELEHFRSAIQSAKQGA